MLRRMNVRPSRLIVLPAVVLALGVAAAPAAARSGAAIYSSGRRGGVEARTTLHHTTILITRWNCRLGGIYQSSNPALATAKISRKGRFSKHLTLAFEFLNLEGELEMSSQSVSLSGHLLRNGTIKGTIANAKCDGGKAQPFTLSFVGYAF